MHKAPTARRNLEDHLLNYPGDYWTCYAQGRLEERREWLINKDKLEFVLKHCVDATEEADPPTKVVVSKPNLVKRSTEYADEVRRLVNAMELIDPLTSEWQSMRAKAVKLRTKAIRRSEIEGLSESDLLLPVIPPTPAYVGIANRRRNRV